MRRLLWVGLGLGAAGAAAAVLRGGESSTVQDAVTRFRVASAEREQELLAALLVTPEEGDPSAVLRRRTATGATAVADREPGGTASGSRPSGRVDEDDPLLDF